MSKWFTSGLEPHYKRYKIQNGDFQDKGMGHNAALISKQENPKCVRVPVSHKNDKKMIDILFQIYKLCEIFENKNLIPSVLDQNIEKHFSRE
jgi:hypothetical protein